MEAEQITTEESGQNNTGQITGTTQKTAEQKNVVYTGIGRVLPSVIEADAVNKNEAKTKGVAGENLDNPGPLHHIHPENWQQTTRMRKVGPRTHRNTF